MADLSEAAKAALKKISYESIADTSEKSSDPKNIPKTSQWISGNKEQRRAKELSKGEENQKKIKEWTRLEANKKAYKEAQAIILRDTLISDRKYSKLDWDANSASKVAVGTVIEPETKYKPQTPKSKKSKTMFDEIIMNNDEAKQKMIKKADKITKTKAKISGVKRKLKGKSAGKGIKLSSL